MGYFIQNEHDSKDAVGHLYRGITPADMAQTLHNILVKEGYSLTTGQPGNGVYERGNRVLRILFGAFVKYFKWTILTADAGEGITRVKMSRETSGMSGGVIGMNQVKNEFNRLKALFAGL
jgi:hypothetical protein